MRMARVSITVPDDLVAHARAAGINISRAAAAGLTEELDRLARIDALDDYLKELEAEQGPIPEAELAAAREWAKGLVAPADRTA